MTNTKVAALPNMVQIQHHKNFRWTLIVAELPSQRIVSFKGTTKEVEAIDLSNITTKSAPLSISSR